MFCQNRHFRQQIGISQENPKNATLIFDILNSAKVIIFAAQKQNPT